jgi:hypothetical protein
MKSDAKATGSDGNKTLLSAASALTSMAEPETEGSESPRSTVPAADTVKSNGDNADEGGASEIRVDDDVPMTFPQRVSWRSAFTPAGLERHTKQRTCRKHFSWPKKITGITTCRIFEVFFFLVLLNKTQYIPTVPTDSYFL